MSIDFNQPILDFDDTPMKDEKGEVYSLAKVCRLALGGAGMPDQRNQESLTIEDHILRFELASRIKNGGSITLKSEEKVLMKKCMAAFWRAPIMVGQAAIMIEGKLSDNKKGK